LPLLWLERWCLSGRRGPLTSWSNLVKDPDGTLPRLLAAVWEWAVAR
jgi:hypothetical protein